jgi:hypothetical protein
MVNRRYIYYLVLVAFFAAIFFRLSINGFDLPYPGNLKSVDAFLHAINSEWVAESGQISNAPPFLSSGYDDVVFFHPPLLYLIPSAMTLWTGLKSHNTIWLFAAIASALPILILFLIGERIFNSKKIGVLGSVLYLLPATNLSFPETFQLYWIFPSYIGAWNLVIGKTLFAIQLWLIWELWNKPRTWNSLLLGIVTGAQILSHIPETTLAIGLIIPAYLRALKDNYKRNLNLLLLFIIPSGAAFIAFLPKLLGVWVKTKPVVIQEGSLNVLENFNFIEIFWSPLLILYVVGLIILLYNWRDNRYWLSVNAYVFLWLGLMPLFFTNREYFGKLRFLVPLVVFPVTAFGITSIIAFFFEKVPSIRSKESFKTIFYIFVALVFIVSGLAQFNAMKQRLSDEEMNLEKYRAMEWLQKNTDKNSKVLLIDGFNIASGVYSKRVTFQRDWIEYTQEIEDFETGKNPSLEFHGRWLEELHNLPYEISFFTYGNHPVPSSNVNPSSFDYAVMWDFNNKAEEYNAFMRNSLTSLGFETVYDKEGVSIMGMIK